MCVRLHPIYILICKQTVTHCSPQVFNAARIDTGVTKPNIISEHIKATFNIPIFMFQSCFSRYNNQ